VWDIENWSRVVASWGSTPEPQTIAGKTLWRNERLAALAAHLKHQQPWKK
jgi:L-gulonate 3-dehydrogenase